MVSEGDRRVGDSSHWPPALAAQYRRRVGNAPWDEAHLRALESRRGEHPLLDEHIEWAIAQQLKKRNADAVEVQLPKKLRLVRVVEKGLPRDA